jgi:hypothetical protein
MFNLDEHQRRILRVTALSAFGFWLCNQIADSTLAEWLWHQLSIVTLAVGTDRAA